MGLLAVLASVGLYLWASFKLWLETIFVAPTRNFNMLWILIPIYLGWIFADFFQEKKGTSLGNAISNATIALWAGIDWIRTTVNGIIAGAETHWAAMLAKSLVALLVVFYAVLII
jgi:hypothetical protein